MKQPAKSKDALARWAPLVFLALAALPGAALADPPPPVGPPDLPKDWVAQCGGQTLRLPGLAQAMLGRVKQDLLEPTTGALTVLRQMTEERVVLQESQRLGLAVADEEVTRRIATLDREVRERSGGKETLRDVMEKHMHVSPTEFRASIRHLMRKEAIARHPNWLGPRMPTNEKERLAQIEAVVTELLKRAKVVYGIETALDPKPAQLAPGVVATINGDPVTAVEFGVELARRLPADDVLRIIQAECKAVLSAASALTEQEMEAEIQKERESWLRRREMSTQEAMKSLTYDDYVKFSRKVSLEDLKRDRFFRGLFGLIRSFRDQVKPEEVAEEHARTQETLWGPAIRVVDVQINFVQGSALVPQQGGRERKDALRLANEILVKKESGMPFDQIAREVESRRDPSLLSRSIRLRNTDSDRILWEKASGMRDGEVAIVETISAVHVLRREAGVPAPAFEDVKGLIAEGLATRRAQEWLQKRIEDPTYVKIRWPLPEDAWPPAR